jgi:O-methyltransferase involved in polyketide biosynthesis
VTDSPTRPGPYEEPTRIDISVAHPARVYDYLVGGSDHFTIDRRAAEHMSDVYPGGFDDVRAIVRAFRAFLGRTLRHLVVEAGVRQILDIGTGIQTRNRPHEVAQQLAPETRMVYVDPDPVALAHAHTLRSRTAEGATAYVHGDLRDVDRILGEAAATLDFTRPVAVRHYSLLNLMSDDEADAVVARLLDAVPPGSYLVLSTVGGDIRPETAEASERLSSMTRETWFTRTHAEVCRFFQGLDLVEPGVVTVDRWRVPEPPLTDPQVPLYGGVGRKP